MDKKNQSSKSKYGTMTAQLDANQDYASSTKKDDSKPNGTKPERIWDYDCQSGCEQRLFKFDAKP